MKTRLFTILFSTAILFSFSALAKEQKLGTTSKEEEIDHRIFLRSSMILLKSSQWSLNLSASYLRDEANQLFGADTRRELSMEAGVHLGGKRAI